MCESVTVIAILTKFFTQVVRRKISAEFVNGLQFIRFKMAILNIKNDTSQTARRL